MQREDNPFEDEVVAKQWIASIEGEKGMIRDNELYPFLREWSDSLSFGRIVEIGAGQGIIADKIQGVSEYIGVEPSPFLVARAKELYAKENRKFIIGNAYQLPLDNSSVDAAISINVWFHLEDLHTATKELARVLEPGGHFLISTANPDTYESWENLFEGATRDGKVIDGKVRVPVQAMDRNRFYCHSFEEILQPLDENNLVVEETVRFGFPEKFKNGGLFITILGHKTK